MYIYILLLVLIFITSVIVSYSKNEIISSVFKIATILILFVPAAIRYGIGTDYWSYVDIFNIVGYYGIGVTEIGFDLLNKCVYDLGGTVQWVIAISAFVTIVFAFKNVENKRWLIYSVLFVLVIYSWMFTTIRQMISASFAFYALRCLEKDKKIESAFVCLFAFLFHYSSVMYPIVYYLCKQISINKGGAMLIVLGSLFMSFFMSKYLIDCLVVLAEFTKYSKYIDSDWFQSKDLGSGLGILVEYVIYIILLLFYPLNVNDKNNKITYNILLIYSCVMIMSSQVIIANRISRGLIFILFPSFYSVSTINWKYSLPVNVLLYFLLVSYFLASLINGNTNLLPYKVCF